MSLPNSLRSYDDCRKLYEAAKDDPKGARACLGTHDACIAMRTRMHYFRKLDRDANAAIYPVGDPMHGTSVFDDYMVQILQDTANEYWLYVQPHGARVLAIEGLSEIDEAAE